MTPSTARTHTHTPARWVSPATSSIFSLNFSFASYFRVNQCTDVDATLLCVREFRQIRWFKPKELFGSSVGFNPKRYIKKKFQQENFFFLLPHFRFASAIQINHAWVQPLLLRPLIRENLGEKLLSKLLSITAHPHPHTHTRGKYFLWAAECQFLPSNYNDHDGTCFVDGRERTRALVMLQVGLLVPSKHLRGKAIRLWSLKENKNSST